MLREQDREDAAESAMVRMADQASLRYASDAEPGIRRKRSGKGFRYHLGRDTVRDEDALARIRALAIPPAWTDVWIAPHPDAHIQATGRDQRGRKQYRYHTRWSQCRDEVKYGGLVAFARQLPAIRARVEADLALTGLPYEKVVATVVWLLDNAMIRVGNPVYARDNKSFGLTTLRNRHVAVKGATIRFAFGGKSGKAWDLAIEDRRMARLIRQVQDLPGQQLFQYRTEDGEPRPVGSDDVNAYIRAAGGEAFSSKYFRTWGGSSRAAELLAEAPLPETKREQAVTLNRILDEVARTLGNTRTVCRKCYVHPLLMAAWLDGTLGDEVATIRRGARASQGLDREEVVLLRWLEQREGAGKPRASRSAAADSKQKRA